MQKINVETYCPICHQFHYVEVDERDFFAWQGGALAQDAFPYLSADEREMLISGICPECWGKMFSEPEEDEEEEDWDDEPFNLDEGFDVYLGEYTWDC